jgi:hypothetical protein
MSTATLPPPKKTTGREAPTENDLITITLRFRPQIFQLLKDMCEKGEANSIADAVGRLMGIGVQARDQFNNGYTEVIFQNPEKRTAHGIDLYRNLTPSD